ncbi:MAG: CHAT domain-containing protein [Deltaproteobacteria bacterium]|nr:CHAT domain-containing protein [Deltaproteobacteria bacterium]
MSPATVSPPVSSPARKDSDSPLADCFRSIAAAPDDQESYEGCLRVRGDPEGRDQAREELESLRRKYPESGWLVMTLGHLAQAAGEADLAFRHYGEAIEYFSVVGEAVGTTVARANRHLILLRKGDLLAAEEEVQRARQEVAHSGSREAQARVLVIEATHTLRTGGDLVTAYATLEEASQAAFPEGSYGLRRTVLFQVSVLAFRLGRYEEALEAYRNLEEVMRTEGDYADLARVSFNRINVRQAQLEREPEVADLRELRRLVVKVLALSQHLEDRVTAARCHALLARIDADPDPDSASSHAHRCLEIAESTQRPRLRSTCLAARASLERRRSPAVALATTAKSIEAAASVASEIRLAHGWRARMRAAWVALPPAHGLDEALRALDAIEGVRDAQRDAFSRASIVSNWASDYSWLAGRILERIWTAGSPVAIPVADSGHLETAFAVIERLRARVLLETLSLPNRRAGFRDAELSGIRQRAAALHRQLMNPRLQEMVRQRVSTKLEGIELEERLFWARQPKAALAEPAPAEAIGTEREALAEGAFGSLESLGSVRLPAATAISQGRGPRSLLEEVASRLAPDEALLSFQVDHWTDLFGGAAGGSWLLCITRREVRVYRLPGRERLVAATSLLRGLIHRRDHGEGVVAAELGRQLLAPVLADLQEGFDKLESPKKIRRLILVPDDVLHRLPFGVLRTEPNGLPLGLLYELVVTPSATLWKDWRSSGNSRRGAAPSTGPALVLADPKSPSWGRGSPSGDQAVWVEGIRLGPLPQAGREGRAIGRLLDAEVWQGEMASEKRLKAENLSRYSVLHFATHAVADLRRPDRSCLVLAPGDEKEDGLLHGSEVLDLDLAGGLVVLSACQTATGQVLRGEGVMSLSRSFFAAGAHAVIGSRWPLGDGEAAIFFEHFYRSLATGESAASSLRAARQAAFEAGLPAQAWAGPVLLGVGDVWAGGARVGGGPSIAQAGPVLLSLVAGLMVCFGGRAWRRLS